MVLRRECQKRKGLERQLYLLNIAFVKHAAKCDFSDHHSTLIEKSQVIHPSLQLSEIQWLSQDEDFESLTGAASPKEGGEA